MQFQIDGMTCGGCARRVTRAIQSIDPTAQVDADPARRRVVVTSSRPQGEIEAALASAGYPAAQTA